MSSSSTSSHLVVSVSECFTEKYFTRQVNHHHHRRRHHHDNHHQIDPCTDDNHHQACLHSGRITSASRISQSSLLFPWRTRAFIVTLISCLYLIGVTSAAPTMVTGNVFGPDGELLPIVAPYVRCTMKLICDLRTHYCDAVSARF